MKIQWDAQTGSQHNCGQWHRHIYGVEIVAVGGPESTDPDACGYRALEIGSRRDSICLCAYTFGGDDAADRLAAAVAAAYAVALAAFTASTAFKPASLDPIEEAR